MGCLFLAVTTATAFSPADTLPLTPGAKLLMMVEAGIVRHDGRHQPDGVGVTLPDIAAAREQAVAASSEALRGLGLQFWRTGEWQMHVTDSAGETVCTLKISGS